MIAVANVKYKTSVLYPNRNIAVAFLFACVLLAILNLLRLEELKQFIIHGRKGNSLLTHCAFTMSQLNNYLLPTDQLDKTN